MSEYAFVGAVSYMLIFLFFGGIHVWYHYYRGGAKDFNISDKADLQTALAWVLFIVSIMIVANGVRGVL